MPHANSVKAVTETQYAVRYPFDQINGTTIEQIKLSEDLRDAQSYLDFLHTLGKTGEVVTRTVTVSEWAVV